MTNGECIFSKIWIEGNYKLVYAQILCIYSLTDNVKIQCRLDSWQWQSKIPNSLSHLPKVRNTSTITCGITSSDMDLKIEWTGSPQQRNKEHYWDRMERQRETCQRLKSTLQPLWITFRKDIKGMKLFPEEQEIWAPQQADQLLHPAQKRQVPKMLNFKNQ